MTELFFESLKHHQDLIDTILKHRDMDGICRVSKKQLLLELGRTSQSWVQAAIDRINTVDNCIEHADGGYIVHYDNLLEKGTFRLIFEMLYDTYQDTSLIAMKQSEISSKYECSLKVVQMYVAYLRSGWKIKYAQSLDYKENNSKGEIQYGKRTAEDLRPQ